MPTYQYRCTECNHEFEEYQSISAPPLTMCPVCQGRTERIISGGAGFLFKGSGFYITDYRGSDYKKKAAKEKDSVTGGTEKSKSSSTESVSKPTEKIPAKKNTEK